MLEIALIIDDLPVDCPAGAVEAEVADKMGGRICGGRVAEEGYEAQGSWAGGGCYFVLCRTKRHYRAR